ncbi:MAG: type II CRISPR-associated endonuclease Cas1 [Alphaproteobacteria bacterium]|nr:type II CRISPR-associated endonuclease Cas1 [Alphaproteobacteria bacterium]
MTTVEIATHGSTLALEGRRLRINRHEGGHAHVPIEDLDLVILEVPAVGVSGAALAALAEAGVPMMVCDARHVPAAWLHPLGVADIFDPRRARRQAALGERTRDRLWRDLVCAKIMAQADLVADLGLPDARLRRLAEDVDKGDPENREATAAQFYWPALFGEDFRRRGDSTEVAALDWGYAVLRAMICRALVAAGLYPAIGLHHMAAGNAFNLADDVIEPYRPLVDRLVREARLADPTLAPAQWKPRLAALGEHPLAMAGKTLRARAAVKATVDSLARIVDDGKGRIALPTRILEARDARRLATDVADGVL